MTLTRALLEGDAPFDPQQVEQPADRPEVVHWVSVPIPEHQRVPDGPVSQLVPREP